MCEWTTAAASIATAGHKASKASVRASASSSSGGPASGWECDWTKPVFNADVFVIISALVVLLSGPIYGLLGRSNALLLAPTPSDVEKAEADLSSKRKAAHEHHKATAKKTTLEIRQMSTRNM